MKVFYNPRKKQAFTLVEMLTAMGVFTVVVTALVTAHMFGLRHDMLLESKLGASDQSRKSFDLLGRDIRSAKIWQVGNGNATSFTGIATNSAQRGTALKLNLTMDTNQFVKYYFAAASNTNLNGEFVLCRLHSSNNTIAAHVIIASNLIGNPLFLAETPYGTNQTDLSHKGVIHTTLEFCQYQYPRTMVGTNGNYLYDRYKMEFRYTPHVPDGI